MDRNVAVPVDVNCGAVISTAMTKNTPRKAAKSQPSPTPRKTKPPAPPGQLTILRKRVGLSLQDMAIETGAERSTVFRWENGDREPEPRYRSAYATALGITLGQLGQHVYEGRARR